MSLRAQHPGTLTAFVTGPRPGKRNVGLPASGAFDLAAFRIANAFLGNAADETALELTLSGPTLIAEADVAIAVFGAAFRLRVGDRTVAPGSRFTVTAGETLRIGSCEQGCRGYLAVRGGFYTVPTLGWKPIEAGQLLQCASGTVSPATLSEPDAGGLLEQPAGPIRVLAGAESTPETTTILTTAAFRVRPASNRMGIRLDGPAMPKSGVELVSVSAVPGTVQLAHDGQCIVLGVDGQTIGGYPKIAHVIAADLDRLARVRPGDAVRFCLVTPEVANRALHTASDQLQRRLRILTALAE